MLERSHHRSSMFAISTTDLGEDRSSHRIRRSGSGRTPILFFHGRSSPSLRVRNSMLWGPICAGFRYRITYEMKRKTSEYSAEVEECREPERLVIRLTEGTLPFDGSVRETYHLRRTSKGTRLIQFVDLRESGMHPVARFFIGLLHRMGRPVGKRYLVTLKELIEAQTGDAGSRSL